MKKLFIWIVVLATLAVGLKIAYNKILDRFFPLKFQAEITKYAEKEGLSKELVMAVINTESGFDEKAHSGVAKGLIQITDETALWICEKTGETYYEDMAYDPETNIKMGCWYLGYLIKKYKNIDTALAAYNAGGGNVDSWLLDKRYSDDGKTLKKIPFGETEKYVSRIEWMKTVYEKAY